MIKIEAVAQVKVSALIQCFDHEMAKRELKDLLTRNGFSDVKLLRVNSSVVKPTEEK